MNPSISYIKKYTVVARSATNELHLTNLWFADGFSDIGYVLLTHGDT